MSLLWAGRDAAPGEGDERRAAGGAGECPHLLVLDLKHDHWPAVGDQLRRDLLHHNLDPPCLKNKTIRIFTSDWKHRPEQIDSPCMLSTKKRARHVWCWAARGSEMSVERWSGNSEFAVPSRAPR